MTSTGGEQCPAPQPLCRHKVHMFQHGGRVFHTHDGTPCKTFDEGRSRVATPLRLVATGREAAPPTPWWDE